VCDIVTLHVFCVMAGGHTVMMTLRSWLKLNSWNYFSDV